MANAYLEIEEYLWFTEYQQGNVNVAGLVFDDLIEESFDLGHEAYVVWNDQIEEAFDLTEAFTPYHYAAVGDTLAFADFLGGSQTRVKQSVLNVVYTKPVLPIKIAHMHLDVVMSGSDTFMEEVSSELQIHSTYANAVPYYWVQLFESFNIEMTEPQPLPPIYMRLYLSSADLVNMRHDVVQDYLFNSICLDSLFAWDNGVWGWDKLVAESLISADAIQEIIGKMADDYLYLEDAPVPRIVVLHIIDDMVFAFDAGTHEKYYLLTAEDTIDFGDVLMEIIGHVVAEALMLQGVPVTEVFRYISAEEALHAEDESVSERYYLCLADETVEMTDGEVMFLSLNKAAQDTFNASATAVPMAVFGGLASESLIFTDIDSYIHGLIIEEGLDLGDVELTRWVFNVLIESGCDIADIIG